MRKALLSCLSGVIITLSSIQGCSNQYTVEGVVVGDKLCEEPKCHQDTYYVTIGFSDKVKMYAFIGFGLGSLDEKINPGDYVAINPHRVARSEYASSLSNYGMRVLKPSAIKKIKRPNSNN